MSRLDQAIDRLLLRHPKGPWHIEQSEVTAKYGVFRGTRRESENWMWCNTEREAIAVMDALNRVSQ